MKKLITTLLLLFFYQNIIAQTTDSLETALKNPKILDKTRAILLGKLAYQFSEMKDTSKVISVSDELMMLCQKTNNQEGFLQVFRALGTMKVARNKIKEGILQFEKQRDLAIKLKNDFQTMESYISLGRAYGMIPKPNEAIENSEKALLYAAKINSLKGFSTIYNNLSTQYRSVGRYEKALQNAIESVKIAEKIGDNGLIVSAYINIGVQLNDVKRYDESIEYQKKALAILEKKQDRYYGIALANLGTAYAEKGKLGDSEEYLKKSLKIFENLGFTQGISLITNNLGSICLRQNKYQEALKYYLKVIEINAKSTGSQALVLQNIGLVYARTRDFEKALPYFEKAEAQKNTPMINLIEVYKHRAELDSLMGNYKSAFFYLHRFRALQDSIINVKTSSQLSELKTKYETEKKEQQISILNVQNKLQSTEIDKNKLMLTNKELLVSQQNSQLKSQLLAIENKELELTQKSIQVKAGMAENEKKQSLIKVLDAENQINKLRIERRNSVLIGAGVLFGLAGLLGYLFYNRRKLKQEAFFQKEVAQQQYLATQAVLEAEERERKRIAADLHDGVGQSIMALKMNLMGIENQVEFKNPKAQNVFEKVLILASEAAKEVRGISHQMMPNALIKNGLISAIREFVNRIDSPNLKINLSVSNLNQSLEPNIEKVLYRVIQESVTNVIKHASATQLDILIEQNNWNIKTVIADNGQGFEPQNLENEGIGLKNIKDRIAFLRGHLAIDSTIGQGTRLTIEIPKQPK